MDATHNMFCNKDLVNPLNSMGMQVSCILVVSHFFNVVLRTVGQPGPIAQILVTVYYPFVFLYNYYYIFITTLKFLLINHFCIVFNCRPDWC